MTTQTDYIGIDYGRFAGTNRNKETGIHYGVISQNSVMPEALDDIQTHGVDAAYEDAVEDLQKLHASDPEALELALEALNQCWESDFQNYVYEREGYKITGCLDNDLFIIHSPYFTHAQFCSPCVPGAGNLDHYCANGPKVYALGPSWFEGNKAPYPVYDVKTGELVESENQQ